MSTRSSAASSEIDALIDFCARHPVPDCDQERYLRHLCSGPEAIIDVREQGIVCVILDRLMSVSGAVPLELVGCAGEEIAAEAAEAALSAALEIGSRLGLAGLDLMITERWAPHRRMMESRGFVLSYRDLDMRCVDPSWGRDLALADGLAWSDLGTDWVDAYLRLQAAAFADVPGTYSPDAAEMRRVVTQGGARVRMLSDGAHILAALRFAPERGFLHSVVRDPAVKGRGFGRLVLDEARRQNPGRALSLNVVSSNRPALDLYHRHGFEILREQDVLTKTLRA